MDNLLKKFYSGLEDQNGFSSFFTPKKTYEKTALEFVHKNMNVIFLYY